MKDHKNHQLFTQLKALACLLFLFLLVACTLTEQHTQEKLPYRATNLPDVSGLAWIGEDLFVAVHDAKNPEEKDQNRVSVLQLPSDLDGIRWKPLHPLFTREKSNDLESIACIPDTPFLLLVESTEEQEEKPYSRRIFLANPFLNRQMIIDEIEWPVVTENVEGSAVAKAGDDWIFIYAERAEGEASTAIQYGDLSLEPLEIQNIKEAGMFTSPYPIGRNSRPVSALEVDGAGVIYAASAEDPGDDNGPFNSAVYAIGKVEAVDGEVQVILYSKPEQLAVLDGIKVESLAVRQLPGMQFEIFVGLDDENYGGSLRRIE